MKILFIFLFTTSLIMAQGAIKKDLINQTNTIFSSSPTTAAFQKFTDVPVSYYTGLPDISINLFNIKEGEITIPITIQYHGGGIKVDEEASQIGLGWSFSVGASFLQNIAGKDDFGYLGYALQPNSIFPATPYPQSGTFDCNYQPYPNSLITNPVWAKITRLIEPFSGVVSPTTASCLLGSYKPDITTYDDFQPDLFVISTLNDNYKAYYDKKSSTSSANKYKIVGEKNVSIQDIPQIGNRQPKIVKTPDGLTYKFFSFEESNSLEGPTQTLLSRTFFCDTISDFRGNFVSFLFETPTDKIKTLIKRSSRAIYADGYANESSDSFNGLMTMYDFTLYSGTKYVSEINFSNGKLKFIYGDRLDIKNGKRLDRIDLYEKNTVIRTFSFNYSYFVSNDLPTALEISSNQIDQSNFTHRLKLLSITDSWEEKNYKFDYDETYNLPKKTSTKVDFWGYYNGQNNMDTYLPDLNKFEKGWIQTTIPYQGTMYTQGILGHERYMLSEELADRRASLYSKACILKKITYPTKGYSEYEFEPNTFSNIPIQSLVNDNTHTLKSSMITIVRGNSSSSSYISPYSVSTFSIKDAATPAVVEVKFNFWYYNASAAANTDFYAFVKNTDTGQIVEQIINPFKGYYDNKGIIKKIVLQPGNYELGFGYGAGSQNFLTYFWNINHPGQNTAWDASNTYNPPITAYVTIEYNSFKSRISNKVFDLSYGAGLRVKKITTSDGVSTPIVKEYLYENTAIVNGETVITSTGKLMDWPKARRFFYENACPVVSTTLVRADLQHTETGMGAYAGDCEPSKSKPITIVQGLSSYGISTTPNGTLVGYTKVIEKINNGSNGYISREYKNIPSPSIQWPAQGAQYLENGMIEKEAVFDNNNLLKKETNYSYSNIIYGTHGAQIHGVVVEPVTSILYQAVGRFPSDPDVLHHVNVSTYSLEDYLTWYPLNTYHTNLNSIVEKEYFNAVDPVIITKTFTYNERYQLIESNTTTSDGGVTRSSKFDYPSLTSTQPGVQALENAFRIDEVVGTSEYVNTDKISEQKNIYSSNTSTSNLLLPTATYTAKFPNNLPNLPNIGALEKKISIDLYGSKGNILQFTRENGVPTTIIWGYNNLLPIAKIENASFSQVQTYVSNLASLSNTGTEDELINALNNLRSLPILQNSLITTYTYKPLTGISTITDPKGDKITYIYDTFRRLVQVVDNHGNILSENEYHYRN